MEVVLSGNLKVNNGLRFCVIGFCIPDSEERKELEFYVTLQGKLQKVLFQVMEYSNFCDELDNNDHYIVGIPTVIRKELVEIISNTPDLQRFGFPDYPSPIPDPGYSYSYSYSYS